MTDPTDLEYCIRDHTGRIVVPWRPVGEVVEAVQDFGRAEHQFGAHEGGAVGDLAAETKRRGNRVLALLGLEPAPDAE